MFNEITIGPLTLHTYGLMIGLGFLAAYAMCYYRGKKMKMEKSGDILYGIFWCAIIGGLVGTRLLYYIVEIPEIIKDPSILWNFKNGYVVYGGIIGGILVSWLSDYAPNGVKLIPTQLISSAGDFMICLMLLAYAKRKPKKGRVASLYLMFYGIGRFGVEFLRSDYRGSVGFLSTSQFISIGIVAAGIILYQMLPRIYEDAKKAE